MIRRNQQHAEFPVGSRLSSFQRSLAFRMIGMVLARKCIEPEAPSRDGPGRPGSSSWHLTASRARDPMAPHPGLELRCTAGGSSGQLSVGHALVLWHLERLACTFGSVKGSPFGLTRFGPWGVRLFRDTLMVILPHCSGSLDFSTRASKLGIHLAGAKWLGVQMGSRGPHL